jgi:UDP-N-acetylmuramate dehydrogenase
MILSKEVPLREHTTFKTGGPTQFFALCSNVSDIQEAIDVARNKQIPWYVLGQGSNVLADDEGYRGVVIRPDIQGSTYEEQNSVTIVTAGAGVSWDALVEDVTARGLWGMENLAGIPGTVGAAPVQNIGAYGVELKDIFLYAEVLNATTGIISRLTREECAFWYRDSLFKKNKNLIITSVAFEVMKEGTANTSYADVQNEKENGGDFTTPRLVANHIRMIRSRKFPDLKTHGTAGSFFKNPVISQEAYDALVEKVGNIPSYKTPNGVKIPLAYVLDKILSLRGFRAEHAWLFDVQPLVLVLDEGGTSAEVLRLAEKVSSFVKEKTNIEIEFEVQIVKINNFSSSTK